ncbi:MAG: MarR family transcriptional regulator, partial [Rhodospirillales bacterium]|nr:MarR family transcriptional regulator [Rhodospirillales bacterium]
MVAVLTADRLLAILRDTIVGTVRRDGPDMSARQFGVFLICYIEEGPHTVRGLAARLEVSKPAITRSIDRLAELGMAKR